MFERTLSHLRGEESAQHASGGWKLGGEDTDPP
jgi:hypothetical protein